MRLSSGEQQLHTFASVDRRKHTGRAPCDGLSTGTTFDPEELAGRKLAVLLSRAEARDFTDVFKLARRLDQRLMLDRVTKVYLGIEPGILATMMRTLSRFTDDELPRRGEPGLSRQGVVPQLSRGSRFDPLSSAHRCANATRCNITFAGCSRHCSTQESHSTSQFVLPRRSAFFPAIGLQCTDNLAQRGREPIGHGLADRTIREPERCGPGSPFRSRRTRTYVSPSW